MEWTPKKIFTPNGVYRFHVPASKSMLNRAFLLAALKKGDTFVHAGALSEDTRTFLACLRALGVKIEAREGGYFIKGEGKFPNRNADLNVGSAGTAARFLPVALAFSGGDYRIDASEQMKKRPMEILPLLAQAGATITYEGNGTFPFRLTSEGIKVSELTVNTDISTQYASGVLLAGTALGRPFTLHLTGSRTNGSYLRMTAEMIRSFGGRITKSGDGITVAPAPDGAPACPRDYFVEPDLSSAAYFYALALLFRTKILVYGVHEGTLQGDLRLLRLLQKKGVRLTDTEEGILLDGTSISSYSGFDENLCDYSDQALTVAVLASCASSPSVLRGIGHVKAQESNRIQAICENLITLGVPAQSDGENVFITPAPLRGGVVNSMGDHRVAMAFSLLALKTGNITISGAECSKKTFEGYFNILDGL